MRKLIPVILALTGLGVGVGAGLATRPDEPAATAAEPGDCECAPVDKQAAPVASEGGNSTFVKINNQFVVPVVDGEDVTALVVLSLNLEVSPGGSSDVYQREPKLRDLFLQAMFDHANVGGFDGVFTTGPKMDSLRTALRETAQAELGNIVSDVLVTDIVRQDI